MMAEEYDNDAINAELVEVVNEYLGEYDSEILAGFAAGMLETVDGRRFRVTLTEDTNGG